MTRKDYVSKLYHDTEAQLFILPLGEEKAFIQYHKEGDTFYLSHSEVPRHLRGQNIGKQLVDQTFAYIQEHGLKAVALCSYIKLIRDRNSEWRALIG